MGVAGLACSLVLLLVSSMRIARRWGRTGADRFWIAIAVAGVQVGAGLTGLSLGDAVTPLGMLFFHVGVTIAVFAGVRRGPDVTPRPRRPRWTTLDRVLLVALVGTVLLTGFEQAFLSVSNVDDRNYRASRAAYWLQHASVFGWDTHNDRQVAFPPGGSMPFFLGVLFTRNETAGLMLQWAAYPLVAAGAFHLLRAMRVRPTASLLGAVVLCFTPIVLRHTRGVQPELWLTLYTLGCAYSAVRAMRRRRATFATAMAAIFAVLAVSVRMTALPLVIVVMLLPLLRRRGRAKQFGTAMAGTVFAVALSGLLPTLVFNVCNFSHPLGSATFRHIHSAEISPTQVRAHLVRAFVVLMEVPYTPDPAAAAAQMSKRLHVLGGDVTLPRENRPWPGRFSPEVRRWAENFSVGGMLVLPLLLTACWLAVRAVARRRLEPLAVVAILAVPFFLGVLLLVRWMGLMGRFWIAPYALLVILATAIAADGCRRRWCAVILGVVVALMAVPAAFHRATLVGEIARPESSVALDDPYAEVLARTPAGATILLAAGQGTRDYPLFRPREGFMNRVVSWGRHAFDAERVVRMVAETQVTHVVVENDVTLDFDWDPPVGTSAMVQALAGDPAFVEIPLEYTPGMRLFARKSRSSKDGEVSRGKARG